MACTMPKKGSLCGTGGRVGTDPASEACAADAGSSDITKIDNALLSKSRARSDERMAIPPPNAESGRLFGETKMGLMITAEVGADPVGQFLRREPAGRLDYIAPVSYTHLRAHETRHDLVCRLLLEKK